MGGFLEEDRKGRHRVAELESGRRRCERWVDGGKRGGSGCGGLKSQESLSYWHWLSTGVDSAGMGSEEPSVPSMQNRFG